MNTAWFEADAQSFQGFLQEAHVEQVSIPTLLTVKEFMGYVGIGRTLLYQLMNEGVIHSMTLGGRRLIPASEVDRLINEAMNTTTITKV